MSVKYHLGCGAQYAQGYINVDYPQSEHSVMTVKLTSMQTYGQCNSSRP